MVTTQEVLTQGQQGKSKEHEAIYANNIELLLKNFVFLV